MEEEYDEKEKGEEDVFYAAVSWFQQSLSFDAFSVAWVNHATQSPWDVAQRRRLAKVISSSSSSSSYSLGDILVEGFCFCAPFLLHGLKNVLEGAFGADPHFFQHKTVDIVHFNVCFERAADDEGGGGDVVIYSQPCFQKRLYAAAQEVIEHNFQQANVLALERMAAAAAAATTALAREEEAVVSFRVFPRIHFWEIPLKSFLKRYLEKLRVDEGAVFRPQKSFF